MAEKLGLAKALLDALQAQGAYVGELETPDGSVVIDGEICPAAVVRALLPLIAAELAGVAREHAWRNQNLLGEKTFIFPATRIKESIRTAEHIALAIEAHARKRGEA